MAEGGDETSYRASGVDSKGAEGAIRLLARWIDRTFDLHPQRPALPLGYFANVIPLTGELALAISTDGVGTKILVAEALGKYDTIGIDCVAMNANDIVCVGARPLALVDYIAVETLDGRTLEEIGKGLFEGARQAGISIPGGELAQVREMIRGVRPGSGIDLVGTCVGTLHPAQIVVGEHVRAGDVVVGLESSGVHSNGLTLARRVLFDKAGLTPSSHVAELGRTVGEELLEPTVIYVRAAVEMLEQGLAVRAFAHITGDGLLNLVRIKNTEIGFVLDRMPAPPPVFDLIQRSGAVAAEEMFLAFNMGIGFCVVADPNDADRVVAVAERHGHRASVIGEAVVDPERRVRLPRVGLVGAGGTFRKDTSARSAG